MYVSAHAREKVLFYRASGVTPSDIVALQDAILGERVKGTESFVVEVPLSSPVLDQSHGNWEYRSNFRAIVEGDTLVTVYAVL